MTAVCSGCGASLKTPLLRRNHVCAGIEAANQRDEAAKALG